MLQLLIIFASLGVVAGLLAGALGLGGGVVIVPALLLVFHLLGFDPAVLVQAAVATSLATIVVTSVSSVRSHHQQGNVRWPLVFRLGAGIVVGAFVGGLLAGNMPGALLARFFGVFAILVSLQMLFSGGGANDQRPEKVWPTSLLVASGSVIGLVSSMFGIGGGSMTVPLLNALRVKMQQAVAVSAACGLPIAVAGGLGFVLVGWGDERLPTGSVGFIYLPAVLAIVLTSYPMARVGARLAHRLPATTLRRGFAVVLMLIGLRLVAG